MAVTGVSANRLELLQIANAVAQEPLAVLAETGSGLSWASCLLTIGSDL